MPQLESAIEKAANAFAREIIAAVKGATLQELLALSGDAPGRRGRPHKSAVAVKDKVKARRRAKINWPKCKHRGCKKNAWSRGKGFCGEHAKVAKAAKKSAKKVAKKAAMAAPKRSAENRRSISSPKCSVQGCGKNRYPRGKGMCGEHYKAALAK